MVLLVARLGRRVLVPEQCGLLDEVAQGVVVALGADIAHVQPGLVGSPGWVYPGSLLAVGLGFVDSPKQLQPVALCLSRDGGPPLELVRTSEYLTLPREAQGSDPNFREAPSGRSSQNSTSSLFHVLR